MIREKKFLRCLTFFPDISGSTFGSNFFPFFFLFPEEPWALYFFRSVRLNVSESFLPRSKVFADFRWCNHTIHNYFDGRSVDRSTILSADSIRIPSTPSSRTMSLVYKTGEVTFASRTPVVSKSRRNPTSRGRHAIPVNPIEHGNSDTLQLRPTIPRSI